MSLTVVFRETALRNLARIRGEDKDLFVRTRRTVALLADQPYPEDAVAWGATGVYRLHAGDIRILYEIDDEAATVYSHRLNTRDDPSRHVPGRLSRLNASWTAAVFRELRESLLARPRLIEARSG